MGRYSRTTGELYARNEVWECQRRMLHDPSRICLYADMESHPMKPLSTFSTDVRRGVRGVFFDIDDTLTTDGRLTAQAYGALEALAAAGHPHRA